MTLSPAELRQLRRALAEAPDAALARVVATLDAQPLRGAEAEAVLDPVRPRLRRLRPPRPLRFARLLFLPLDAAIVPPGGWRRGGMDLPRNAILPIAGAVEAALGPAAAEITARAASGTADDAALAGALGARLWPLAGALHLPHPPPGWEEAGLPAEAAGPLLAFCGSLWRHAPLLWSALDLAGQGPPEAALRAALAPLAAEAAVAGPGPLAAGIRLLLRAAAAPAAVVSVAVSLSPPIAGLAETALERALDADLAGLADAPDLAATAGRAALICQRLSDLEDGAAPPALREARRRNAAVLRREGAALCHHRFSATLAEALLAPVLRAHAGGPAPDPVVAALEGVARDLRRLEAAGRRIGAEAGFDAAIRDAVLRLSALARMPGGLTRMDLARLVEILAGAGAAAPLVE